MLDTSVDKLVLKNKPYSSSEEWLNTASHASGFIAAILGLIFLLMRVDNLFAQVVCFVYCLSMMMMFLSSTLYHGVSNPILKAKLKTLDHSAIYVLIAGTYTPFMLLVVGGTLGLVAISLIWIIALFGVAFKCFFEHRFPKLSLLTYLLMGWLALGFIYPLYQQLTSNGFWLLVAGGFCYTVGVAFYVAKSTRYTHAVWHLFVVAGCVCHYFSIYQNV
ncbi:hemolysin III family protein [Paraglaciecola aquimarina]|uniref:Hemolysin III family protein n=1 Tax=Paraglaciecola algarum TaxID=3050085 RepID=A0ABS9D7T8_9ALTE|nr:hemolysin III family protein [Paraglaciecola sp. G1-23]MCF2948067.1 hemolysin III family protein [Paraglaciecola sp. G1-23]